MKVKIRTDLTSSNPPPALFVMTKLRVPGGFLNFSNSAIFLARSAFFFASSSSFFLFFSSW